ncbi:MAG: CDP-alcohol phosphatidyltransferase family protein, partial [Acidobacteriaceae bacterium]|nr:CDP-alcohol phosphatidyltransferase family protein [Acidobacteriaceae bacterium]
MTYTRAIGLGANKIIRLIVRMLALSRINPNVLTFLGLVINIIAA